MSITSVDLISILSFEFHCMDDTLSKIAELIVIVNKLRDPKTGCPWDKAQTIETIQDNMVEEATEVKDAIAKGDMENLSEELGDVLFNVLLQATIAEQEKRFTLSDVLTKIIDKLTSRHPHVFAGGKMPANADEALEQWNRIKRQERK